LQIQGETKKTGDTLTGDTLQLHIYKYAITTLDIFEAVEK